MSELQKIASKIKNKLADADYEARIAAIPRFKAYLNDFPNRINSKLNYPGSYWSSIVAIYSSHLTPTTYSIDELKSILNKSNQVHALAMQYYKKMIDSQIAFKVRRMEHFPEGDSPEGRHRQYWAGKLAEFQRSPHEIIDREKIYYIDELRKIQSLAKTQLLTISKLIYILEMTKQRLA